jgi:hypothetical protein
MPVFDRITASSEQACGAVFKVGLKQHGSKPQRRGMFDRESWQAFENYSI